jgi:phage terminase large subunit-like protein
MAWQVSHVTTRKDANNNIVPDKKKSRYRIDGIAASIMALECSIRVPVYKRPLSADLMDILTASG